jgi:hypothetical protein
MGRRKGAHQCRRIMPCKSADSAKHRKGHRGAAPYRRCTRVLPAALCPALPVSTLEALVCRYIGARPMLERAKYRTAKLTSDAV